MEHVTSHRRLEPSTVRPDLVRSAARMVGSLGSWLAGTWSDPMGDRLERQYEHDAQLLRRYDRSTR